MTSFRIGYTLEQCYFLIRFNFQTQYIYYYAPVLRLYSSSFRGCWHLSRGTLFLILTVKRYYVSCAHHIIYTPVCVFRVVQTNEKNTHRCKSIYLSSLHSESEIMRILIYFLYNLINLSTFFFFKMIIFLSYAIVKIINS